MSEITFEKKAAYAFAGKDAQDPRLAKFCSIYFDNRGYAITTDRHRLFANRALFVEEKQGKAFKIEEWAEKGSYLEMTEKFPNWDETIPNGEYDVQLQLKVPEWFSLFIGTTEPALFTIDHETKSHPRLISGSFQSETSFGINGAFLAPFAGKEIQMRIHNDKNAILVMEPEAKVEETPGALKRELMKLEWFALIMPIRLDPNPRPVGNRSNIGIFV